MGRAIGLTAGLYVVVLIGAIPVGAILFGKGSGETRDGFASASPVLGRRFLQPPFSAAATARARDREAKPPGSSSGLYRATAWSRSACCCGPLTLKTFNRCLGRIDNRLPAEQPFLRPARKPATWLPDAEPALDLDLRHRPAAPLADPLASDH